MKRGKLYRRENKELNLFSGKRKINEKIRYKLKKEEEKKIEIKTIKIIYGIRSKQLKRYFKKTNKKIENINTSKIIKILERRLDNVIYRCCFCDTRKFARQTIVHKNVKVNNKIVNCPSYIVKKKDVIEIIKLNKRIKESNCIEKKVPNWIKVEKFKCLINE